MMGTSRGCGIQMLWFSIHQRFEIRSIVEGYRRVGLFEEMLQSVADMEDIDYTLGRISFNMVL